MPVTLNISSRNITLLAVEGNTFQKWETVPLPADIIKDGLILQPQAAAAIIDALFSSLQLPRNQVTASITGLSFTYRILKLPAMKPSLLPEAVERATRKEINLPLDELYIDWQIINNKAKESEVFVAGVPRNLIDSLLQTMELAKIRLTAVDLKPLALARMAGQANALIVDCEPDCFDITIVSQGIPLILHSVTAKSRTATLEDNVSHLVDEITRTIDFYNLAHNDHLILPDAPILLAGSLASEPLLTDSISGVTGHPVQLLTSGFKVPENFPLSSMAGNLGLILKGRNYKTGIKYDPDVYYDINLNPLKGKKRISAHPIPLRKVLLSAALVLAIILVLPLSILRNQALSQKVLLQSELDRVNRSLFLARLALNVSNTTENTISELKAKTETIQKERELISGKGELSAILQLINDSLPSGTINTAITSDPKEIIVSGQAASRTNIFDYARNLEKSNMFSDVRIASIANPGSPSGSESVIPFQIVLER